MFGFETSGLDPPINREQKIKMERGGRMVKNITSRGGGGKTMQSPERVSPHAGCEETGDPLGGRVAGSAHPPPRPSRLAILQRGNSETLHWNGRGSLRTGPAPLQPHPGRTRAASGAPGLPDSPHAGDGGSCAGSAGAPVRSLPPPLSLGSLAGLQGKGAQQAPVQELSPRLLTCWGRKNPPGGGLFPGRQAGGEAVARGRLPGERGFGRFPGRAGTAGGFCLGWRDVGGTPLLSPPPRPGGSPGLA